MMHDIGLTGTRCVLLAALICAYLSPAKAQDIGSVVDIAPDAYGTPPLAQTSLLGLGAGVVADELVQTLAAASVHIVFLDETDLRVGASSMVVLDRLVFDPDQGATELVLGITVGVARIISGTVDPAGLEVHTPVALVGVRGTDFIVHVDETGRTTVIVLEGEVVVTPNGGSPVIVVAGQTVVVDPDPAIAPAIRNGIEVPPDPGLGPIPAVVTPPPLPPREETIESEVIQVIPRSGVNPLDPDFSPETASSVFTVGVYAGDCNCTICDTSLRNVGSAVFLEPFGPNGTTAFVVDGQKATSTSTTLELFGVPNVVPHSHYQARDGRWLAIACTNDRIFARLAEVMGQAELADEDRYGTIAAREADREAVDSLVSAWVGSHDAGEVLALCDKGAVPCGPVYSIDEIFADPQYQARKNIRSIDDPRIGALAVPGVVPRLTETPGEIETLVFGRMLGLDPEEIAELQSRGIV